MSNNVRNKTILCCLHTINTGDAKS